MLVLVLEDKESRLEKKIIKVQAATRRLIKRHCYFRIRRGIVQLQSCARRLFLFCNEEDVVDMLILDAMALRCHRINSKAMNLKKMRTILNLLHEKGFYFIESNH